jgi:hypothetical protein
MPRKTPRVPSLGRKFDSTNESVRKAAIIGWIISLVGMGVWLYGYFVTGHPSLLDWRTITPWWIADFLPNFESEVGFMLMIIGTGYVYWPSRVSLGSAAAAWLKWP